jgi:hypothetical protein
LDLDLDCGVFFACGAIIFFGAKVILYPIKRDNTVYKQKTHLHMPQERPPSKSVLALHAMSSIDEVRYFLRTFVRWFWIWKFFPSASRNGCYHCCAVGHSWNWLPCGGLNFGLAKHDPSNMRRLGTGHRLHRLSMPRDEKLCLCWLCYVLGERHTGLVKFQGSLSHSSIFTGNGSN